MPSKLLHGQKAESEAVVDRFLAECADSAPGYGWSRSAPTNLTSFFSSGDIRPIFSAFIGRAHQRCTSRGQNWNDSSRNLVTIEHLPNEVLVKILQLVDYQDILNASQVSHSWNCVVATASVWSVVDLGQLRTSNRAELNTLLSKSQRSPLTIFCSKSDSAFNHCVVRDICTHIDRMMDLELQTDGWNSELDELMFGRPAPLLKSLVCGIYSCINPDFNNLMQLPANLWPGANCKVELLALGVFSLADTANPRPIPTVRFFRGFMEGNASYARNLFAYFPNLTFLQLELDSADCILNLPFSFPNGLQLLKLVCEDQEADWGDILERLPPSLQTLSMTPVHNVISCLALMKRMSPKNSWWFNVPKLRRNLRNKMSLIHLGSDLGLNFEFVFNAVSGQECFATPNLFRPETVGQNLISLDVSYFSFELMRMQASEIGSLVYLRVHSIPVDLNWSGPESWDEIDPQEPIRVPRLESVTFEFDGCADSFQLACWYSQRLPDQLCNLVQFDAERLHSVKLVCYKVKDIISSMNFCCLGHISQNVSIRQKLACHDHADCWNLGNSEVVKSEGLSMHAQLIIDEDGWEYLDYSITPGKCLCNTYKYV
ncbi:hypothetical protein BKA62DRAFT_787411 [Auriculariales sp. MPI-PUGE-AT-0066]|nr:hypothetical protein BKA62DRAFT_787411 [Auriculariales sp. MPI-PUGE-AT-0066]